MAAKAEPKRSVPWLAHHVAEQALGLISSVEHMKTNLVLPDSIASDLQYRIDSFKDEARELAERTRGA